MTIGFFNSGGGASTPSGAAGGALTGTYPNPGVNVGAGASVTGVLPDANQAAQTVSGDVTGNTGATVVGKVNGATIPVSGALTTGNGLYVTGASALSYSALNLAGGAAYVSGVLPAGNQASQTMAGDVTGTTAASLVTTITGAAGVVNVATSEFEWSADSSPELSQLAAVSGAGTDFLIAPQSATTTGASGNLVVNLGLPASGSAEANLIIKRNGTIFFEVSPVAGLPTYSALWLGQPSPSGNNYTLTGGPNLTVLNVDSGGTILFSTQNGSESTPLTITKTTSTFHASSIVFQDTIPTTALTLNIAAAGATNLTFARGVTASIAQTAAASGAGTAFTISPQAATTTGASGQLLVNCSAPASGTTEAGIVVQRAAVNTVAIQALQGTTANGAVYLGTNAVAATPSSSNYALSGGGSATSLNATTTVNLAVGGTTQIALTSPGTVQWTAAATANLSQVAAASGAGTNFTISPQAPTTTGAAGSLVVNVAAPASGTAEGAIALQRAGTGMLFLQPYVGSSSSATIYPGGVTPSATNYAILFHTVGTDSRLNAITGGIVGLYLNNVGMITATSATISLAPATLQWINSVSTPVINQAALASTSGGSGSTGQTLALTSQAGQAATGASNNGGAGGTLQLAGGAGGTSGSATAGVGGTVNVNSGLTVRTLTVSASTYTVDTNSTTSDLVVFTDSTSNTITVTLPVPTNGRKLWIKDKTGKAATHNVTISHNASETIDGANTVVFTKNYDSLLLISDGTNWSIMGEFSSSIVP